MVEGRIFEGNVEITRLRAYLDTFSPAYKKYKAHYGVKKTYNDTAS
jgi:hypothetical protein